MPTKENQRIKSLLTSAVIVALVFVGGACLNTGSRPAGVPSSIPTTPTTPTATARTTSTPAARSPIRIESVTGADDITLVVTTTVSRGQAASATVTTIPNAFCAITVTYPSGLSAADGLGPKDADGGGSVSWSWTVEASAPAGSWPVEVTCGTVSGLRAVAREAIVVR